MKPFVSIVPLLIIPVFIYNCIAFTTASSTVDMPMPIDVALAHSIFVCPMISGGMWTFRLSNLVLFVTLISLFAELIRATSTRSESLVNHGLSLLLLLVCLIEFLLIKNFATSLFFLLTMAVLLDVIAGFMITIVAARRDIGVTDHLVP